MLMTPLSLQRMGCTLVGNDLLGQVVKLGQGATKTMS